MPVWLNVILEIIKISVPALIVYYTAYQLMSSFLDKQLQMTSVKNRQRNKQITLPMRLQAYERISLLCERISLPTLILRLRHNSKTAADLRMALLLTIQQEFEYNITQQVYVSAQLWEIIKLARDNTVAFVEEVAGRIAPDSEAKELATAILNALSKHPELSLERALVAIKKEASAYL